MKKIATYIIIASLTFCLQGCSALDEKPTTTLSGDLIASTEGGLESLVTGCYQSLRGKDLIGGRIIEYLQEGSLLLHWGFYRMTAQFLQILDLARYSTDEYNQTCFTNTYKGINYCNTLIRALPDSPVDEAYKKEIEAEAKLIRAVFYYMAVRMWGDLPLITVPPTNLKDASTPRSSYIDIYKLILEDLTFAETYMRDKDRQEQINGQKTRACKWAATAWKACVYLQIGCILSSPDDQPFREYPDFTRCGIPDERAAWTLALQTAENVINNGPYELAATYSELYRWTEPGDWFLKERIFVLPNSSVSGTASFSYYTLPEYPEGTSNYSTRNTTWGRVRPERWVFQKWAATYGGTKGTGRSDKLENVYVNCGDPRFDASYIYGSYKNLNTNKTVKIYPSDGLVAGVDVAQTAYYYSSPFFRKYLSPDYNGTTNLADFYFLRFAEMYLCAAEAAAELSTSAGDANWEKAMDYIEVLHARARATKPGAVYPKWEANRFSSKEELLLGIFWERVYEMSGECHEWFDMRRRGANWAIENIIKPMNAFLQEPEQGRSIDNPIEGASYFESSYLSHVFPTTLEPILKGMLCAFPDNEIRTNSAISEEDQNPYYYR